MKELKYKHFTEGNRPKEITRFVNEKQVTVVSITIDKDGDYCLFYR